MSGISRIGVDTAGGTIIGMLQNGTVFANSSNVSVNSDPVQGHGTGVHAGPVMVASCNDVFINGIMVCKAGNQATCGHPSSGSLNVFVG